MISGMNLGLGEATHHVPGLRFHHHGGHRVMQQAVGRASRLLLNLPARTALTDQVQRARR